MDRVQFYNYNGDSETLEIEGKKNKPPNCFFLFFDHWIKSGNVQKKTKMRDASKKAAEVWNKLPGKEKEYWRKLYETIRDKDVIHDLHSDEVIIDHDRSEQQMQTG